MDIIDRPPQFDENYAKLRYEQYLKIIDDKLKKHQKPHDRRYKQGFFIPKRPLKNINIMETNEPQPIVFRSAWEKKFFEFCDSTDAIIRWGSEVIRILYKNPVKNKMSFYEPDIYLEYIDNNKNIQKELIEIKPKCQSSLKETSNGYDKIQWTINQMKWASAIQYCKKRNMKFKVITEYELGLK